MRWHLIVMLVVSTILLLLTAVQMLARKYKFEVSGGCFWGFLLLFLWLVYGGIFLWQLSLQPTLVSGHGIHNGFVEQLGIDLFCYPR